MKILISASSIKNLKPDSKPYDARDTRLNGFIVRVYPSGKMSYVCAYARGKRTTIGSTEIIKATKARDRATTILGEYKDGIDPASKLRQINASTWGLFLENEYGPWVTAHRKDGKATLSRLNNLFQNLDNQELNSITPDQIEKWRTVRISSGRKPSTVNRDLNALKAAFSKAVEWGLISTHPLKSIKRIKTDQTAKVRYLSVDEEKNLRNALELRAERIRTDRDNGNLWRDQRGLKLLPSLRCIRFVDHLEPAVLVSINTGLRRGELFSLQWQDIDLTGAVLTITGDTTKSGSTRHIPLNKESLKALKDWRTQTSVSGPVFKGRKRGKGEEEKPINNMRKSWSGVLEVAEIGSFRWHDLRHHFASKLVMAGVDLNTVRELLGHSDIKMTLRYAHLAPGHKAAAVEKLTGGAPF